MRWGARRETGGAALATVFRLLHTGNKGCERRQKAHPRTWRIMVARVARYPPHPAHTPTFRFPCDAAKATFAGKNTGFLMWARPGLWVWVSRAFVFLKFLPAKYITGKSSCVLQECEPRYTSSPNSDTAAALDSDISAVCCLLEFTNAVATAFASRRYAATMIVSVVASTCESSHSMASSPVVTVHTRCVVVIVAMTSERKPCLRGNGALFHARFSRAYWYG